MIACSVVIAVGVLAAAAVYLRSKRGRASSGPAVAHPTKEPATPEVNMADIRWATPKGDGKGGAPQDFA